MKWSNFDKSLQLEIQTESPWIISVSILMLVPKLILIQLRFMHSILMPTQYLLRPFLEPYLNLIYFKLLVSYKVFKELLYPSLLKNFTFLGIAGLVSWTKSALRKLKMLWMDLSSKTSQSPLVIHHQDLEESKY